MNTNNENEENAATADVTRAALLDELAAFPQEGSEMLYNVWRYTSFTECVLWGVCANDPNHAKELAADKYLSI